MTSRPKLASPEEVIWPCISIEEEKPIIELLESVFSKFAPCLRTVKKRKTKRKHADVAAVEDKLSQEEEQQRKSFKSQFVVGIQSVIRGLERDRLQAVLLWKDLQPAVLRKGLLHLVSQHHCPAVCISDMLTPLQKYWTGLSSAAAFGVLKTEEPNVFEKLVELTTALSPIMSTTDNMSQEIAFGSSPQEVETDNPGFQKTEKIPYQPLVLVRKGNNSDNQYDSKKYHIIKSMSSEGRKSFSGQSFIAFGTEAADNLHKVVEFSRGVRVKTDGKVDDAVRSFGISLARSESCEIATGTSESDGLGNNVSGVDRQNNSKNLSKRKPDSDYKAINVKRLKINTGKKQRDSKNTKKKQKTSK